MSDYGIPYMGSKEKIAASIALNFPKADHFYDLFGGGFSMSHYMVENKAKRYKHFHYNEIKADVVDLVKRSIAGEFNYDVFKPEWISREDFFARKDTDAYVRCVWSFGNNQKGYLFGSDIEPYKRSMHQAIVFDDLDAQAKDVLGFSKWPPMIKTITERRLYLRQRVAFKSKGLKRGDLEQLERLGRLERLHFYSGDYRKVPILQNSVVYCDIPYKGTADYIDGFNHKEFYDWAMSRDFPVYVSEYNIEDQRFKLVYEVDKRSMLSQTKSNKQMSEKLYWNGVSL